MLKNNPSTVLVNGFSEYELLVCCCIVTITVLVPTPGVYDSSIIMCIYGTTLCIHIFEFFLGSMYDDFYVW